MSRRNRRLEQTECVVSYENGVKKVVTKVNGYFKCSCGVAIKSPENMSRHARKYCRNPPKHGDSVAANANSNANDDGDQENDVVANDGGDAVQVDDVTANGNGDGNQYDEELESDLEYLKELGLFVNQQFGMVICTSCRLPFDNILSHLSYVHGSHPDAYALEAAIARRKANSMEDGFPDDWLERLERPIIDGLPVYSTGRKCNICGHCSRSKDAMSKHLKRTHNLDNDSSSNCMVQGIERGKYFSVVGNLAGDNLEGAQDEVKEFINHVLDGALPDTNDSRVPLNRRAQLCFPFIADWSKVIQQFDQNLLKDLVAAPKENERLKFRQVHKLSLDFLQRVRKNLNFKSYNIAVAIYEGRSDPVGATPFRKTECPGSDARYAYTLAHIILFFYRLSLITLQSPLINLKNQVSHLVLSRAAYIWNNDYDVTHINLEINDDDEEDNYELATDLEEDFEVEYDSDDDGEYEPQYQEEIEEEDDEAEDVQDDSDKESKDSEDSELDYNVIVGFMRLLSRQFLAINEDRSTLHLFHYVVCSAYFCTSDGMQNTNAISRRMAFIEYGLRGACLLDCLANVNHNVDDIIRRVSHSVHGNFKLVHDVKALLKEIGANNNPMPKVFYPDPLNRLSIIINGVVKVTAGDIARGVDMMITELNRLFDKLFGKSFDRGIRLDTFVDRIASKEHGYSFLSEHNNYLDGLRAAGTRAIYENLGANVVKINERFIISEEFRNTFYDLTEDIVFLLLGLIHLTYGLVARGSELLYSAIYNNVHYLRSIYVCGDHVVLLGQYNKTRSVKMKDKYIARFLPKSISRLLAIYLVRIRPLETALASEKGKTLYKNYLFVLRGKIMTAKEMYNGFKMLFAKYLNLNIGLRDFRHVVDAFLTCDDEFNNTINNELMHSQAGHCSKTANMVYARSHNDFHGIAKDRLLIHQQTSFRWHDIIGQGVNKEKASGVQKNDIVSMNSVVTSMEVLSVNPKSPFLKEYDPLSELSYIPSSVSRKAQELMKTLLGTRNASFRTREQFQATCMMMMNNSNVMYIAGTGSGKTLTFLIASAYICGKVSVIVVPTISTKDQMVKVLIATNYFQVCNWDTWRLQTRKRKIIVAIPIELGAIKTKRTLLEMRSENAISHIVIDEAQQVISWSEIMTGYHLFYDLGKFNVPVHFMSGGLPKSLELEIKERTGWQFQCIRTTTERPNLKLSAVYTQQYVLTAAMGILEQSYNSIENEERIIVFLQRIIDCVTFKDQWVARYNDSDRGTFLYHGELERGEKTINQENWMNHTKGIMICTDAFAFGIDHPKVRYVINIGPSCCMETFVQQIGRAGRDGELSNCILVINERNLINEEDTPRGKFSPGFQKFIQYARSRSVCRRSIISSYMDGMAYSCNVSKAFNNCAPCDICSEASAEKDVALNHLIHNEGTYLQKNQATRWYYLWNKFMNSKVGIEESGNRYYCVACWLDKNFSISNRHKAMHLLENCSAIGRGTCSRCYSDNHVRNNCNDRDVICPVICRTCLFPERIDSTVIHHVRLPSNSCDSIYKDSITRYFLWLYKNRIALAFDKFQDINDRNDLCRKANTITNQGVSWAFCVVSLHLETFIE